MSDIVENIDDINAALAHLGWENIGDLHYWAMGNDIDRFERLACRFAKHRKEAEAKAADEIQSLRQRVERLEQLLEIAVGDHDSHMGKSNVPVHWTNQARAALSPKVQEGE